MPTYSASEWRGYVKDFLVPYDGPLWKWDGERMEEILDMVWWRIRGLDEDERQQYIKDLIDLGLVATSSNEEKEADEDS